MARLSTQVNDLSAALKSAQTVTARPEIPAADLFNRADGDRMGGKLDLALQEYSEFVARFGTDGQASDAQYYIGSIHYSDQDWDDAVKSFDVLLKTYLDIKRAPEALYYTIKQIPWPDWAAGRKQRKL